MTKSITSLLPTGWRRMADIAALRPAQRQVLARIADLLGVEPDTLSLDATVQTQAQWDSYVQLEIMMFLEGEKGVEFSEENIARFSILSEILKIF